ncbi:DUF2953 domain-containing protein [Phosphitispora fastidiosa]|uniref:DUF2953 domain-containing protein n=1 Tax=Phosphitispora fastidiosa TaxID=2837202 RepID=UPI001E5D2049|nr:DUF2953 domain-containing protein [Phosphitispora fastidiosa]MBU7005679.1 putative membrane protein [Phosphitispora fastidiosa]
MDWWAAILIVLWAVILLSIFTMIMPWSASITVSSPGEAGLRLQFLKRVLFLNILTSFSGQTEVSVAGLRFRLKKKEDTNHHRKEDSQEHKDVPEQDSIRRASLPGRLSAAVGALTPDTFIVLLRYFRGMIGDTDSRLEISGELGLGDPAATGIVCGMAYGLCGARGVVKVDIRPNFFEPVLAGKLKLTVTAVPMFILLRTLRTAFHPAIRRVWIALAVPPRRTAPGA